MRGCRGVKRLEILGFFGCLILSPAWGQNPADDEVLTYAVCSKQVLAQAGELWTPEAASARTLDGKFDLTLRIAYRLRSFYGTSNSLATKLALSPEGLRFLILHFFKGSLIAPRTQLEAILSQEERPEFDALLPLIQSDSQIMTLVTKLYSLGNQIFGESKWRDVAMGDPLFVPLLATFCGGFCEENTKRVLADFDRRYTPADQNELARQMAFALAHDGGVFSYMAGLFEHGTPSVENLVLPRNQIAVDLHEFVKVLADSAGYTDIGGLNKIMVNAWVQRTGHLAITFSNRTSKPFWRYATSWEGKDFVRALTHLLKGQDAEGLLALNDAMIELRKRATISDSLESQIRASLFSAALDRRLRITALGQFVAQGKASPELILANLALRNIEMVETRNGVPFMPMQARYQQVPLINAALLYAALEPGSRVLEIGYEKPVLLPTLRYYLPHIELAVGVDPAPLPPPAVTEGLQPKIQLIRGRVLSDTAVTQKVERTGPYALIYGVDVFRTTYGGYGADFDPSMDMQAYLNWVYENLDTGGTFLVLNDNSVPPNFTRQQAEQAGLTVVRWAEDWSLPVEMRNAAGLVRDNQGVMHLFVFRKGVPRSIGVPMFTPAN